VSPSGELRPAVCIAKMQTTFTRPAVLTVEYFLTIHTAGHVHSIVHIFYVHFMLSSAMFLIASNVFKTKSRLYRPLTFTSVSLKNNSHFSRVTDFTNV